MNRFFSLESNSSPPAAVAGHLQLGLTVTPKVHLMLKHMERQMVEIDGGLGNKLEDWVEKQHQMGKRERMRFRTMHNLQERANARARVFQWGVKA